jgi:hypothetical protein
MINTVGCQEQKREPWFSPKALEKWIETRKKYQIHSVSDTLVWVRRFELPAS